MEEIILNLLNPDSDIIKKATADLQERYKHPETIPQLCDLIVTSSNPQVRQYAAVLLKKRLGKLRNWQMVPPEQQAIIKKGMLNALVNEPEKPVRNSISQFVGVIVRHEADNSDPWMNEVLTFIYAQCSSSDPKLSELGSSIFSNLTDVAPDQFVPHMGSVCEMFSAALITTEQNGNMATPVIYNILTGMTYLVPFILGHHGAEQTYQKSVPLIIKALHSFAQLQDPQQFINAFDILESMADYTPKLLTLNLRFVLEFCLSTSSNAQLDSAVRIKTVAFIGWLVRLKKKAIIKQKMIEPILEVIFKLMSSSQDNEEDDEEYFLGDDSSTPMTTATQTMDLLALNVPPEKLIPPLLTLLEPALQGIDPLPRRAAYLSMAVIAEGCSEAICSKYLETMLNIVKNGITDVVPIVRNAAFFALGQFSEHLQPEISLYAPQILPILFEFLQQLCTELKNGGSEPKHIDRMFYALETFCENLQEALVPHLPLLMERLFDALNPNNSVRVRELALSTISAAANATKENMLPYFQRTVSMLQPYLMKSTNEDIVAMRPQAIDTLAALARTIGKENFMPLANDTMTFALDLLSDTDDPDVRRAIYNLIASLASVVGEELAAVYPKIMDRIYDSVLSTEEVIPEYKDGAAPNIITQALNTEEEHDDDEIDIEDSSVEDMDNLAGYNVENSYLDEKEEAILALKEFAKETGVAFMPYLPKAYEHVYKMIDHPQEDIRKVTIDALAAFVKTQYKHNDVQGVVVNVLNLVPKFAQIVNEDEEVSVVMSVLEAFTDLFKELKSAALPNEQLRNLIYKCIKDVLQGKLACQFEESIGGSEDGGDESEYDEAIVESACNLISYFGCAMTPEQFAYYFKSLYALIIGKMQKNENSSEADNLRALTYGAISECLEPLQHCCANFFDKLCPFLIQGLNDRFDQVRQNAVFGLGELVYYSKEKSYDHFPTILNALSNAVAKETKASTLDNICGAIARLILTNYALIPLEQVLPVFLKNLPLRDDVDENSAIFKAFRLLYLQAPEKVYAHLEQILSLAISVLYNKEYADQEGADNITALIREIRQQYPDKLLAVTKSNPNMVLFLSSLEI